MMKVLAIAGMLLMLAIGCAHSAPVTFDLGIPLYNAIPGTCNPAVGDTCKDINQAYMYRRAQGAPLTDSTLVLTINIAGLYGKSLACEVEQTDGTFFYWAAAVDALGNRSCNSTLMARTVTLKPAPPTLK